MRHKNLIVNLFVLMLFILTVSSWRTKVNAADSTNIKLKVGNKAVTNKILSMKVGKTKTLKAYLNNKKVKKSMVTFKSAKKSVVSISKKGVIEAKKSGTAKIKVVIKKNGKKYKSWIKVKVMKQQKVIATTETIDINIKVRGKIFPAKIYNNDAGKELLDKMPFTLNMEELNGNEKYYYLDEPLKTSSKDPEKINTGDIKLYGSDCLVVFYKSFSTSYHYTDIGYIVDSGEFAKTVGIGDVKITFEK